ncbi:HAD family hydrolase [Marinilabilia rubra]|uniref:HAD family phosphatase n=1 Tax=Marinilabilia rubra TaxID=2162893 RepID=A0A2U2B8U3_9BACT|nr:HAD family phosphatase [Marinilabilia rubra]PWD99501.1 HAD family phosphatase [Marinilabilia rubra]
MTPQNGIKNIIFDLGNVLIPLKTEQATKAFLDLMPEGKTGEDIKNIKSSKCFFDYETGRISTDEFLNELLPFFKPEVKKEEIANAWKTIIGEFPVVHVEMLQRLRQKYRIFVLSNTNEIHASKFEKEVPRVDHLKNLFERLYYSHQMGLRKPQSEIYNKVLADNNLIPSETLFADDLPENIETAKKLGIQTLLVTPELELNKWFEKY